MTNIANLLTEHMAIWTAAESEKKSGRGRASGNAGSVYGVKKLRELILELAVRGKLVPHDPNDESASELLKRIQAEKAKLIAEGKLKKEKPLAPIGEDEKPFELPKGWEWARLGNLTYIEMGQSPDSENYNQLRDGIPFFQGKADFGALYPTERYWCNKPNKYSYPGDVLLSIRAPVGPTNIANQECCIGRGLAALRPVKDLETFYLLTLMRSFEKALQSKATGTTFSAVSRSDIDSLILPICSLNQQRLIVNKVDELMVLCDQLEQQHSNAQEAHETLVSQLLATLTQSQNTAEFNANWQRIYAHFDVLFTTEASIDALKQTLLQLAVMGKLVPQDPNDEPASELLKRIQAEKAKLIAEGKLKKEKPLAPISEGEKPFELPKGWVWARLNEAIDVRDGTHDSPKEALGQNTYPLVTSKDFIDGEINFDSAKRISAEAHYEISKRSYVEKYDILFSMIGGNIGNQVMVNDDQDFSVKNVALFKYYDRKLTIPFFVKKYTENLAYSLQATAVGGAQPFVALGALRNLVLALPPLSEQHRIVAKVDALMAMCDQLKTRIQQANQQQQTIADALVTQALKPATAEIIDLATYRAAVTCNIIKRMQHNHAFGRTFAMKLLYLSQQHIGFETHLEFEREAAGPFDKWIYDFERDGIAAGWFGRVEKSLSNGHTKIEYQVKSAIDEPVAFMNRVGSREQRNELDRLFALFADKKTEEAEIVATLFAAWNDFLFDGVSPTDEQIIQEVRENWHSSKERFSPEQLIKWLNWLRGNNIVPTGKGSKTIYQAKLIH